MSVDFAHAFRSTTESHVELAARTRRERVVLALGPLAVLGGVLWAVVQPWRLTLLHPGGQGFWWLVAEPPLYVVLVGILFRWLLAPGLVEDLRATREPDA